MQCVHVPAVAAGTAAGTMAGTGGNINAHAFGPLTYLAWADAQCATGKAPQFAWKLRGMSERTLQSCFQRLDTYLAGDADDGRARLGRRVFVV